MLEIPEYTVHSENKCPSCGNKKWDPYWLDGESFKPEDERFLCPEELRICALIDNNFLTYDAMDICTKCGIALTFYCESLFVF